MKKALIIGAGPAGISASLYLARAGGIEVTVLSHGKSALEKAEQIENYFGFAQPISGKDLLANGRTGAKRLGVRFIDSEITDLQITADLKFSALTSFRSEETYDTVLIATGASRKTPGIKGLKDFEGKGVSYCAVCDAFFYRNKPTAVIGSGNYAAHEASVLSGTSSSVFILTDGQPLSADTADNITVCDKKIKEIHGSDKVESVIFEDDSKIAVSGVFVAIGTAGSTELARKTGVPVAGNKIITDENRATAVPGIYAAGDCIGGLLQVSKSVADGAIAAMSMIKFLKKQ